jgi:hypothetical protein
MHERNINLHYIDLKNFENFKIFIRKFLVKTFLKKKNIDNVKKINKSEKLKSSNSVYFVKRRSSALKNTFDKKVIKSLSFNLSDGDGSS